MKTRGLQLCRAAPVLAALLAGLATLSPGALAQATGTVGDFRLPPGPQRSPTPAQGPVDDEVPVVRPTRAAPPEPVATPAATPSPTVTTQPGGPAAAPATVRTRRPEAPVAAPAQSSAPTPAEATVPQAAPSTAPVPIPSAAAPADTAPAEVAAPAETGRGLPGWAIALAVLVVLAGLAAFVLRRQRAAGAIAEPEAEPATAPAEAAPSPSPPASLAPPQRAPAPAPAPAPAIAPGAPVQSDPAAGPLAFALDAHHLSRSLVYVTLAYRLTIANAGEQPMGPLRIAADLSSAHASRSRDAQLRPAPGELEQRHALTALAPGESATLTGELRLPVSSILAIQQGQAQLFVPLARFAIEGEGTPPRTFVFVIGQPGDTPGAGLRPFRIDAMPGVFRDIDQREIGMAA